MFHFLFFHLLVPLFTFFSDVLVTEKGKWEFNITQSGGAVCTSRSLFQGSPIIAQIHCLPDSEPHVPFTVTIDWTLAETSFWDEYFNILDFSAKTDSQVKYYIKNHKTPTSNLINYRTIAQCNGSIYLPEYRIKLPTAPADTPNASNISETSPDGKQPIFVTTEDGLYFIILRITSENNKPFIARVNIEMKGIYGYLSATEWPLLPFYGTMFIVYLIFAMVWLLVSFLRWRDLLWIQFWISAVILIGIIENALFLKEYNTINSTGETLLRTIFIAELVSVAKHTLDRVLVIIVSLGYGIINPKLGSHVPRVMAVGTAFFILAFLEAHCRIMKSQNDPSSMLILASIPLALLDCFICYWIFVNLVQTKRTLRLTRNLEKLTLYNNFTNTLIFAVVASTIFKLWSMLAHRSEFCSTDWKTELWIDNAYWNLLFSVILFVIMVLCNPTKQ